MIARLLCLIGWHVEYPMVYRIQRRVYWRMVCLACRRPNGPRQYLGRADRESLEAA